VGLVVVGLTLTPWAINTFYPPAGTAFVGTFYYVDDFYNYLSYAQQAENGAFVFTNKAVLADHAPALVNLEWWTVGSLSRLRGGGHLLSAYRIFGVLTIVAFLLVADRWLERLGLGEGHRLPALLLVATGGGLGGVLFGSTGRGPAEFLDLFTGLFPFVGFLTNPHFTAGTTLLLLALLLFDAPGGRRGLALATAVAMALALVRPYDFVLLVLIRGTAVLLTQPARRWPTGLLPLCALLPAAAYLYWLFYRNPAFAFYTWVGPSFPKTADFLWALGPALVLALPGVFSQSTVETSRRARLYLVLWGALAVLVIVVRPVTFSLQFLVGVGFPLLALGALGLQRFKPPVTLLLAAFFAVTFGAAVHYTLTPRSFWLTGRETMSLMETLRTACGQDDILLAPADVGLFAYGLTPCRSFLSHRISPGHDQKLRQAESLDAAAPMARRAWLDSNHVRHLILTGDAGSEAEGWLGPGAGWARVSRFGVPPSLTLYSRR
jgi:hypothetical protein